MSTPKICKHGHVVDDLSVCGSEMTLTAPKPECPRCGDLFYHPKSIIESEKQRAEEWEDIAKRSEARIQALEAQLCESEAAAAGMRTALGKSCICAHDNTGILIFKCEACKALNATDAGTQILEALEKAREALEWYGNGDHHIIARSDNRLATLNDCSPVHIDGGRRAKHALKVLDSLGGGK